MFTLPLANQAFINGGQLIIGWANNPILTNVTINFTGEWNPQSSSRRKRDTSLPDTVDSISGLKGIAVR